MPRALWFAAAGGWLQFTLACGAGLVGLTLATAPAWAQPPENPASGARSGDLRDDGDTSSSFAAEGANTSRVDSKESFLSWMARASGPIGLVILAMSFYLIALVVWMALRYRAAVAIPRALVREIDALLEDRKYSEAYHRADASESFLGRVLAAGVRKLPAGLIPAHRAMEMANEDATMEMEHRTTYLATVGTLGPMIGLVGTVYGMILSFRVIATEGSSPQASQLAAGISTALFATLEGIAISIPAIYFYSMFRNRISRLSLEVAMAAEPLLERFAPGIRPQDATPGQAPTQPAVTVPVPMPGPASHPHPYAASAALAAAAGAGHPRTALPPATPEES